MKHHWRRTVTLLAAVTLSCFALAGSLTERQKARIHPDFLQLFLTSPVQKILPRPGATAVPGNIDEGGEDVFDAIIYTSDPASVRAQGVWVNSVLPRFVTARLSAGQILKLAACDAVQYVAPAKIVCSTNDVSVPATGATLLHEGFLNSTPVSGVGSIVLIYDTGIDWKHADFRMPGDSTKTRILAMWDQTLSPQLPGESNPSGFNYGVEYTQPQINSELGTSPPGIVREQDINGHGTHVAGTAVGNGLAAGGKFAGMAPQADLIIVKGGNGTFSTVRMIDGLTYAANKSAAFGEPVVVNWSIGGQSGPHDGSNPEEQAVDAFVTTPGRVVCIAAGNDGGRAIHCSGQAGNAFVPLNVPVYTPNPGTGNDKFVFDIWFAQNPTVSAVVRSPNGDSASAPFSTISTLGFGQTGIDGFILLENNPQGFSGGGGRQIELTVRDDGGTEPAAGMWVLEIRNADSQPASYDGWVVSGTVGSSSVSAVNGDDSKTVNTPGTSQGGITVGAYVTKWSWPSYTGVQPMYGLTDRTDDIATFSSIGPTADGRVKPDLAAPGQGIVSSLSSDMDTTGEAARIYPGQKYWLIQGTSMATPHVTGAAALMLSAFPALTAAEIKGLLMSSADEDTFTGSTPNTIWGSGKLDVLEAFGRSISPGASVIRKVYGHDAPGNDGLVVMGGSERSAVRISPGLSGRVTGVTVEIAPLESNPVVGSGNILCEIFSDDGGLPGTMVGQPVSLPLGRLIPGSFDYISMTAAGADVTGGADYYVVLSLDAPSDAITLVAESNGGATESLFFSGGGWSSEPFNFRIRGIVTTTSGIDAVAPIPEIAHAYRLEQNFPNPFNPTTVISLLCTIFSAAKSRSW
jgi:minor extracellular serine protease Vpr